MVYGGKVGWMCHPTAASKRFSFQGGQSREQLQILRGNVPSIVEGDKYRDRQRTVEEFEAEDLASEVPDVTDNAGVNTSSEDQSSNSKVGQ